MTRSIAVGVALVLVAGVLLDPYTFRESASDEIVLAPWWQMALGLADAALLVLVAILLWRRRSSAFWIIGAELLYALTLGAVFVARDGVSRFLAGIGAREYLTLYLGTLALRVVLLMLARTVATGSGEVVA